MTLAELLALVDKIPGPDGWWHSDGQETFRALADEMVAVGMDHEQTLSVLERAYGAAAGEFGS
jgi:hypothetical protein